MRRGEERQREGEREGDGSERFLIRDRERERMGEIETEIKARGARCCDNVIAHVTACLRVNHVISAHFLRPRDMLLLCVGAALRLWAHERSWVIITL